jgi:hypothetical protein
MFMSTGVSTTHSRTGVALGREAAGTDLGLGEGVAALTMTQRAERQLQRIGQPLRAWPSCCIRW